MIPGGEFSRTDVPGLVCVDRNLRVGGGHAHVTFEYLECLFVSESRPARRSSSHLIRWRPSPNLFVSEL